MQTAPAELLGLHPTIAAALAPHVLAPGLAARAAEQAKASAHYGPMAAEAQLSRRATDERVARVALLRRAISNLVQAERLADQADTPELSAATADALFNAQMNVERLLSELAQ